MVKSALRNQEIDFEELYFQLTNYSVTSLDILMVFNKAQIDFLLP